MDPRSFIDIMCILEAKCWYTLRFRKTAQYEEPPGTTRNHKEPPRTSRNYQFLNFLWVLKVSSISCASWRQSVGIHCDSAKQHNTRNHQEQPRTARNHQEPPGSIDDLHKRPRSLKSHARQHFWYVRLPKLDHLHRRLQASQVAEVPRAPTLFVRSKIKIGPSASTICTSNPGG